MVRTGFTNVIVGKDGIRTLTGMIHPTAEAAIKAQSRVMLFGGSIHIAQLVWKESDRPEKAADKYDGV
jgi:hypothetical protein